MMRWLTAGFLVVAMGVAQAAIYRWVDNEGVVVYSDQPRPGAEQVEVQPTSTYTPPAPPARKDTESPVAPDPDQLSYRAVTITGPADDATVRDNQGIIRVEWVVEPPLQVEAGDRVVVLLDGEPQGYPLTGAGVSFSNIDRGTHTVRVDVVDAGGSVYVSSDTITFHMHRTSRLGPTPVPHN